MCKMCFEEYDSSGAPHCCKLAPVKWPRFYCRQSYLDIETFTLPGGQLRDCVINFSYEQAIAGVFSNLTFHHRGFVCAEANVIRKNHFAFDYLPSYIGNQFDDQGRLRPKKQRRKRKEQAEADNFEHKHWSLHSYIEETHDNDSELMADMNAYRKNLRLYHSRVPPYMRVAPSSSFCV